MTFPSLRLEGAILSPELFARADDLPGQRPTDFGLPAGTVVKDEIARAWADAQDYWRIFQRKLDALHPNASATTETRNLWIVPLLGLLGYQLERHDRGLDLHGKLYPISHHAANRAGVPVHIVSVREPAGLDRRPERTSGPRMSAHGLVQEYLNLADQTYGLATNGRLLRLLRDSSRLVKLTYLEFDLDRIFTDGLYADFALLYRFLHASRLPASSEATAESLIERYHLDSVEAGARIRDGLSKAVETAIKSFANGLLAHPKNDALRAAVQSGQLTPAAYYSHLLRLIYRLLFLLVIEERNLVYPLSPSATKRDLYIAGNPPYLGGKKISGQFGDSVLNLLKHYFEGSEGGVDLVSYFVRRASELISTSGYVSFITTKKIAQGDTRQASLEYLIKRGFRIHFVNRSVRWPGAAASVTVSTFGFTKNPTPETPLIDGKPARQISSYFDDEESIAPTAPLAENADKSFQGVVPLGEGFYLSPLEAERLLAEDSRNADVLKKIVNGSTLNSAPDLQSKQWIISFFDRTEEQAKRYPSCFQIVRDRVSESRQKQKRPHLRERWWQYAEKRPLLYATIAHNQKILARTQASKHNVFEFIENGLEYDQKLIIFSHENYATYSVLNSDVHFAWILKYSGDIGGVTLNYSPTLLFETFPLPKRDDTGRLEALEQIGAAYSSKRRALMLRLWLGLTDIYNLFHDRELTPAEVARVSKKPAEAEAGYDGILQLRALHRELDEAVLAAYDWTGQVALGHDFHEVETLPENDRVRYTISPAARKELLRRLLALNHQRAAEEKAQAASTPKPAKKPRKPKSTPNDLGLQIEGELPL